MSDALETAVDAVEATASPFALTPEHEFSAPQVPSEVDRVDVYRTTGSGEPTLIASAPPDGHPIVDLVPAMPGTAESDYRRCPCIGVMPGRACPRCNCSKWVRTCPKCEGKQLLSVQARKGAHPRTERCGFCMGLGQVAARLEEVGAAEETARAAQAVSGPVPAALRREVRLPNPARNSFADRAAKKATAGKRRKRG